MVSDLVIGITAKLPGTALLSLAYQWYARGVTPLPLYYASKHPAVFWREWVQQRPPWEEVAAEFITHLYRGIGLLMGGERGLVVLDFDQPLPYYQWRRRTGLDAYTVRTSRGYHVYCYLDDPPTTTLSMVGGEVKGNGYVVAPPSVHPSGHQYEWTGGLREPLHLPNLHALGITLELPLPRPERPPATEPKGDQHSLIDDIKRTLALTQFLSRYTVLEPSGDDFLMGVCPFHNDHHPSLWVNPRLQICGCFSPRCPAHGRPWDVINAYSYLTGLHNGEAIFDLAQQLGLA